MLRVSWFFILIVEIILGILNVLLILDEKTNVYTITIFCSTLLTLLITKDWLKEENK